MTLAVDPSPTRDADAPGPDRRVFARYAIFQVPGLVLASAAALAAVNYWQISPLLAGALVGLWVVKDLVLFPLVWRSYEPDGSAPPPLVGLCGVAQDALDPAGWVRVGPELWRAELVPGSPALGRGARVRVVGIRDLMLAVEAAPED